MCTRHRLRSVLTFKPCPFHLTTKPHFAGSCRKKWRHFTCHLEHLEWNIVDPKETPYSRGSRDSGTFFIFAIFRFEVPRTGMQNEPTFSVQVLVLIQLQYTQILTVPDGRSRFTFYVQVLDSWGSQDSGTFFSAIFHLF